MSADAARADGGNAGGMVCGVAEGIRGFRVEDCGLSSGYKFSMCKQL
jgi:hypothetical protein